MINCNLTGAASQSSIPPVPIIAWNIHILLRLVKHDYKKKMTQCLRGKCRLFTQKATQIGQQNRLRIPLLIRNKLENIPLIDYQVKSISFGRTCQRMISGRS